MTIAFLIFLLYLPFCLVVFWKLAPSFSSTCRWLAASLLAAQLVVLLLSLFLQPPTSFGERLWNINREFNIPSLASSTQLAVAGGVALLAAWRAPRRPLLARVYLLGLGLAVCAIAFDEFFTWKSYMRESRWIQSTIAHGVFVAAATVFVAALSPRASWKWHLCLLGGLAISAFGGIYLDLFPLEGKSGPYEESLENLGGWLMLISALGHFSSVAPLPKRGVKRLLLALPCLSVLVFFAYHLLPRLEMRVLAQPAAIAFQSDVHLRGYRIDIEADALHIRLYPSASAWKWNHSSHTELGYSISLIDQASGAPIAGMNRFVRTQLEFLLFGPDYLPIYLETTTLPLPPETQANRAFWIVFAFWREKDGDYLSQYVVSSDHKLFSKSQVILGEFALRRAQSTAAFAPLAVFDAAYSLGAVDLPASAVAGQPLAIPFSWRAEAAGDEALTQFLHLGHEESGAWHVHDQAPLGQRLPTRLWYKGMEDSQLWQVPLPADLAPGRYSVFTGLYRASDKERLPAVDAEGEPWLDGRVRLGALTIET